MCVSRVDPMVAELMKDIFKRCGDEAVVAVENDPRACLISLLRRIKDKLRYKGAIETEVIVGLASSSASVRRIRVELEKG